MSRYIDLHLNALERQIDLIVQNLATVKNLTVNEQIALRSELSKIAILTTSKVSGGVKVDSALERFVIDIYHSIFSAAKLDLNCTPLIDTYAAPETIDIALASKLLFEVLQFVLLGSTPFRMGTSLDYSILDYSDFLGRASLRVDSDLLRYSILQNTTLGDHQIRILSSLSPTIDLGNSFGKSSISLVSSLSHKVVMPRPMATLTGSLADYKNDTLYSLSYIEL